MRSTFEEINVDELFTLEEEINVDELFTLERKLINNPHNSPTIWRKKSSRTAWLARNKAIWFYFRKHETVYGVSNG